MKFLKYFIHSYAGALSTRLLPLSMGPWFIKHTWKQYKQKQEDEQDEGE